MKIPNLEVDVIKLRFVPFSLKDLAKKWLYSLEAGSISSWDNFVKAFLNKFYPVHKNAQIRKIILYFKQTANELFESTSNALRTSLPNALIMGIEK